MFSALDVNTAVHLYNHCFCSDLLHGRTVILVTQIPWIGEQADFEVRLDGGMVKFVKAREGVVRTPISVARVLATTRTRQQEVSGDAAPAPGAGQLLTDLPSQKGLSEDIIGQKRNPKALCKFHSS